MSTFLTGMHSGINRPATRSIVPIQERSIRRIVAGQAVNDLASAVKELVDNSLDAGATTINIRLFKQGAEVLEVSDDGSGVPLTSRPFIAAKNATSKIRQFEDIYDENRPTTLGFRGEALFCLANISRNLIVATRTATDALGQKLEFRQDGHMDRDAICEIPRKVGTTVAVVRLFDALPVRQKDLIKRIRKHRAKLMKMIQGYAILCVGVKFTLMDMVGSGDSCSEDVKLSTQSGTTSIEQTVSSVLGSRFLSGLSRISIDLTSALLGSDTNPGVWRVEGLISKAPALTTKGGSTARESQFFSINHRPIEMPKIGRIISEVWRTFAGTNTKRPACILCFTLPNNSYDCNLSPDKREVFLVHESMVSELIRNALVDLWSSQTDGNFVAGEAQSLSQPPTQTINEMERLNEIRRLSQGQAISTDEVNRLNEIRRLSQGQSTSTELPNLWGTGNGDEVDVAQDDAGLREKARRRNAFVHDLKKARMQHEEESRHAEVDDEEDISPESSPQRSSPSKNNNNEATDRMESPPSNRTKPPAPQSSRERVTSDRDRINLTQTKIRFNRENDDLHSQEAEIDAVNEDNESSDSDASSTNSELRRPTEQNKKQRNSQSLASSKSSNENEIDVGQDIDGTEDPDNASNFKEQANRNTSQASSKKDLSQFAFPPRESSTIEVRKKSNVDSANKRSIDLSGFAFQSSETTLETRKRSRLNPQSEAKRTRAMQNASTTDDDAEIYETTDDSISASVPSKPSPEIKENATTSRRRARSVLIDKQAPSQNNSGSVRKRRSKHTTERRESEQIDDQDTSSSDDSIEAPSKKQRTSTSEQATMEKESVTFDTFQSTKQAIQEYQDSRFHLHNEKLRLRYLMKSGSKTINDSDCAEAVEAGVNESVGVSDDTDKDLANKGRNKIVSLGKEDFRHMSIIGQFNHGFILARCRSNNLWILDQHACDEKFNYERLCENTSIHEQRLMAPMPLELTPSEEECILDNKLLFEENGFRFSYDKDKPPRHRLALISLPHSGAPDGKKAVQYGKEDVSHLCALLGADGISYGDAGSGFGTGVDGSGLYGNNAVRRYAGDLSSSQVSSSKVSQENDNNANASMPQGDNDNDQTKAKKNDRQGGRKLITFLPKSIAMFASRACRGSIMIGTPLSQKEMEAVVERLADVEHPWSCPHGRPTMRHVRDLMQTFIDDVKQAEAHVAGPTIAQVSMTQPTQTEIEVDEEEVGKDK